MSEDMHELPASVRDETDWSRWLVGACSSGDSLRGGVVRNRSQVVALRARIAQLEAQETEWALRWGPADAAVVKPVETEKRARALAPHVHDAGVAPEIVSRFVGPWVPADETGAAS